MNARLRILLAAEHAIDRTVMVEQLRVLGHSCDTIPNNALDDYDLIFIDEPAPSLRSLGERRRAGDPAARRPYLVALGRSRDDGDAIDIALEPPAELDTLRAILERANERAQARVQPLALQRLLDIFDGDEAAALAFLRTALDDLGALVAELSRVVSLDDIERIAHELKGAAHNIGATPLAEAARTVVEHAREGRIDAGGIASIRARFDDLARAANGGAADHEQTT